MRLAKKIAFITGGNSGIGLATARVFIAEGARVAITGRNQETLDKAKAELGDNLLPIRADVTHIESLEGAVASAVSVFGKIDIVFANAGIGIPTPVGSTTLALFEEIIRTNLTSVFFTVQAAAQHLNAGASIVLNGSVNQQLGVPGLSAYSATKGGLRSMTRNLASEFAPRGIRVNQVTPGFVRTPIWSPLASNDNAMKKLEDAFLQIIPLAKIITPEDVAKAVLYLASDDSSCVTGAEIVIDAGMSTAPHGAPAVVTAWAPQ